MKQLFTKGKGRIKDLLRPTSSGSARTTPAQSPQHSTERVCADGHGTSATQDTIRDNTVISPVQSPAQTSATQAPDTEESNSVTGAAHAHAVLNSNSNRNAISGDANIVNNNNPNFNFHSNSSPVVHNNLITNIHAPASATSVRIRYDTPLDSGGSQTLSRDISQTKIAEGESLTDARESEQ